MSRNLEAVFDECLNQVNKGKSLKACVHQYPALAAELEPLLRIAFQLKALRQGGEPSPAALQAGKEKLLREAARLKRAKERESRTGHVPLWLNLQSLMRRSVATVVLATLLLVAVLGGGAMAASAKSLPGDALYPVKRMTEEFRLLVTFDRQAKAQLLQKFDERRREEARAVASSQRIAEMSFRGRVESMDDSDWTIGGVPVSTSDETVTEGEIEVGTLVRVRIRSLSDGTLLAIRVSAEPEEAIPEPTASPTPTLAPTAVPTPTKIAATTALVQPPPSTPTASPTTTLQPSATPSATATAIPATRTPPREVKIRFKGIIEAITADAWTIGGQLVRIGANTRIDEREEKAAVGVMARVLAIRHEDDTLLAIEIAIERAAQAPEQPFEFQGLIESFGPTQWIIGGYTVLITADTLIEGSPQEGLLAEVKALRQSDGSVRATHIVVRLPSEEVQFEGLIEILDAEEWIVDGITVRIDAQTIIIGTPAVGYPVEIQGLLLPDGAVLGRRIVVQQPQTATLTPGPSPLASPSLSTQALPTEEPDSLREEKSYG